MPIKWKRQKFCSHSCYWKNRKGKRVSPLTEFKKGMKTWNKGKKGTANQKSIDALRNWTKIHGSNMKGKNHTEEAKKIIREKRARQKFPYGKNHWLWRGGTSRLRERIMNSKEYREWRNSVFNRDDYTCVVCGQIGGRLNAHHIKSFYQIIKNNKIRTSRQGKNCKELWDIANGRTLCIPCHKQTPSYLVNQFTKQLEKVIWSKSPE